MKKTFIFCVTAGLLCLSAQSIDTDESQEIAMGSNQTTATKEDCRVCKEKDQYRSKKGEKPPRKSAARRVIEGS